MNCGPAAPNSTVRSVDVKDTDWVGITNESAASTTVQRAEHPRPIRDPWSTQKPEVASEDGDSLPKFVKSL